MSFRDLGLSDEVLHGVQSMGYVDPTPIQLRSFPAILSGRDLIASAQTGTGKTAAFALPLLSLLGKHQPSIRTLVLEPTRELAAQVETAFRDYARLTELNIGVVYGGVGFGPQREMIKKGADVLVATPGRLIDFLSNREINLSGLRHLILDEMDRMLDMGFMPQVRNIVERCPKQRQTMLFSATMPPEIAHLTSWVLNDPEVIEIGASHSPADTVTHALYPVAREQKFDILLSLLEKTDFSSVLIFCRTKDGADRIAHQLKEAKHSVAVLHSNRTQRERMDSLEGFKSGKYEIMVATDIASRGIDIAGVSHVINYDVPMHPEDYVHRIGRTGRAQNVGDAFTIMTGEDVQDVAKIEYFIGQKISRLKLEGFNYLYTAMHDTTKRTPIRRAGGKRRRR